MLHERDTVCVLGGKNIYIYSGKDIACFRPSYWLTEGAVFEMIIQQFVHGGQDTMTVFFKLDLYH